MTAQAVKSYGLFAHGTEAFFVRPSYDSSTGHFHVRYGHLGNRVADNLNVVGQIVDATEHRGSEAPRIIFYEKSSASRCLGVSSR